jgi:CheY-like chemotaxis protein
MRVLIVEDELLIAMDLETLVDAFGHDVCAVAAPVAEAIVHAAAHRPDAALLDIRLSHGSSGIEVAREMHARHGIRCMVMDVLPIVMEKRGRGGNPAQYLISHTQQLSAKGLAAELRLRFLPDQALLRARGRQDHVSPDGGLRPVLTAAVLGGFPPQTGTEKPRSRASRPGESHLQALSEPSMRLSPHSAPIRQTCRSYQSASVRKGSRNSYSAAVGSDSRGPCGP